MKTCNTRGVVFKQCCTVLCKERLNSCHRLPSRGRKSRSGFSAVTGNHSTLCVQVQARGGDMAINILSLFSPVPFLLLSLLAQTNSFIR